MRIHSDDVPPAGLADCLVKSDRHYLIGVIQQPDI